MVLTQMLNVYANGFKDDESTLPCSTSIYQYEDHRRHLAAGERAEAALPDDVNQITTLASNSIR